MMGEAEEKKIVSQEMQQVEADTKQDDIPSHSNEMELKKDLDKLADEKMDQLLEILKSEVADMKKQGNEFSQQMHTLHDTLDSCLRHNHPEAFQSKQSTTLSTHPRKRETNHMPRTNPLVSRTPKIKNLVIDAQDDNSLQTSEGRNAKCENKYPTKTSPNDKLDKVLGDLCYKLKEETPAKKAARRRHSSGDLLEDKKLKVFDKDQEDRYRSSSLKQNAIPVKSILKKTSKFDEKCRGLTQAQKEVKIDDSNEKENNLTSKLDNSSTTTTSGYESDLEYMHTTEDEIDSLLYGDLGTLAGDVCSTQNFDATSIISAIDWDLEIPINEVWKADMRSSPSAIDTAFHNILNEKPSPCFDDMPPALDDMPPALDDLLPNHTLAIIKERTAPILIAHNDNKLNQVAEHMNDILQDLQSANTRRPLEQSSIKASSSIPLHSETLDRHNSEVQHSKLSHLHNKNTCSSSKAGTHNMPKINLSLPIGKNAKVKDTKGESDNTKKKHAKDCKDNKACSKASKQKLNCHSAPGLSYSDFSEASEQLYSQCRPKYYTCMNNFKAYSSSTTSTSNMDTSELTNVTFDGELSLDSTFWSPESHKSGSSSSDSGRGSYTTNYSCGSASSDIWNFRDDEQNDDSFVDFIEEEPVYETIPADHVFCDTLDNNDNVVENPYASISGLKNKTKTKKTSSKQSRGGVTEIPPPLPARSYQCCQNAKTKRCQKHRQQKPLRYEDVVKSTDIVDMDGKHIYTVADVLESFERLAGHLPKGRHNLYSLIESQTCRRQFSNSLEAEKDLIEDGIISSTNQEKVDENKNDLKTEDFHKAENRKVKVAQIQKCDKSNNFNRASKTRHSSASLSKSTSCSKSLRQSNSGHPLISWNTTKLPGLQGTYC